MEPRQHPPPLGLATSTPTSADAQLPDTFSGAGSQRAGPASTPLHSGQLGGQFWSPMADLTEHEDDASGGLFKGLAGLGSLQQELRASGHSHKTLPRWTST